MLTLTYALVALSVEQKKLKTTLLDLQQAVQREKVRRPAMDLRHIGLLFNQFERLEEACQVRNIELYVLPIIRVATAEADKLLADMDTLTSMGRIILKAVRGRLREGMDRDQSDIYDLCNSLESYCQNLLKRLAIEETYLLPIAQRVISVDEWFDIAAQFISHETERHAKRAHDAEINSMPVAARRTGLRRHNDMYQAATEV